MGTHGIGHALHVLHPLISCSTPSILKKRGPSSDRCVNSCARIAWLRLLSPPPTSQVTLWEFELETLNNRQPLLVSCDLFPGFESNSPLSRDGHSHLLADRVALFSATRTEYTVGPWSKLGIIGSMSVSRSPFVHHAPRVEPPIQPFQVAQQINDPALLSRSKSMTIFPSYSNTVTHFICEVPRDLSQMADRNQPWGFTSAPNYHCQSASSSHMVVPSIEACFVGCAKIGEILITLFSYPANLIILISYVMFVA